MVEATTNTTAQRQYFVGGNWKCNGTLAFAKDLVENVLNKVEYNQEKVCK
jgi:triosephosphate isomerase